MAMWFMDGFDYLSAANTTLKWNSAGNSLITPGIYGKGSALTANITKTLPQAFTTGMCGFHFFTGTLAAQDIILFLTAGSEQCDLRCNSSGNLFFSRAGTTIGSTTSFAMLPNQWYWIEIQVTISTTVGVANLYVNGTSYLTGTSLNTAAQGGTTFNQLEIATTGSLTQYFDNFHFWDQTAGDVTSFPYSEHIIDTQFATGVGANTTWTNVGAAQNYLCVNNKANVIADNVYVKTNTASNIDSYAFANLAESGTIGTIAVNLVARADDGMSHVVQMYTQSSATTNTSSNVTPTASYANYQSFFGLDPNTGLAWTDAGRNAAYFGEKLIV